MVRNPSASLLRRPSGRERGARASQSAFQPQQVSPRPEIPSNEGTIYTFYRQTGRHRRAYSDPRPPPKFDSTILTARPGCRPCSPSSEAGRRLPSAIRAGSFPDRRPSGFLSTQSKNTSYAWGRDRGNNKGVRVISEFREVCGRSGQTGGCSPAAPIPCLRRSCSSVLRFTRPTDVFPHFLPTLYPFSPF